MPLALALRASGRWQFDLRSAIIGALVAWCIAGLLYSQRALLLRTLRRTWEPVAAWRRRQRASQEEKVQAALHTRLKELLWFTSEDPATLLRPRHFRSLAPLPTTLAEVGTSPRTIVVPQRDLLSGHRKLVITGPQGSGRTTVLLMAAGMADVVNVREAAQGASRLPLWIDLARPEGIQVKDRTSAAEHLVSLAIAFLPQLLPAWVLQQLRKKPCLVLVDNWEALNAEQQERVSGWIAEADEIFADVIWVVTSGPEGFGPLIERGFVSVELLPYPARADVTDLYTAWCKALDRTCDAPDEETLAALGAAADAGAPLWELHLRSRVHIETGVLPQRPVEVVDRALLARIEAVDLGRISEELVAPAQQAALDALAEVAAAARMEGQAITERAVRQAIVAHIPAESEQARRIGGAARKLIEDIGLLVSDGKDWRIANELWSSYLTACYLAQDEAGDSAIRAHVDDPTWAMLVEFCAGIADMTPMVETLISRSEISGDVTPLLRIARWGIGAEPDQPWRTAVIKVLAQTYIREGLELDERLALGRAVAHLAGDGARAFFMRVLRQPLAEVRGAALRGIGWCGAPQDLTLLTAALRDAMPLVRESAVWALRDTDLPEAVTILAECLPQVDETLMPVITEAMATTQEGWSVLEEASRHPDLLVRRAAASGLCLVHEAWAEERLLEMAREDPEWLVRSAADAGLQSRDERDAQAARVPSPPQPDALDWLIAWAARQGTGLGVGDAALDMLARAAREGNVDAKILSALTLAQIGRRADIPTLESLLDHEDPGVTRTAAWALNRLRLQYRTESAP